MVIYLSHLIDFIQNMSIEVEVCNTALNAKKEEKEVAWNRIAQLFRMTSGAFDYLDQYDGGAAGPLFILTNACVQGHL